jgi:hypothetical protein
MDTPTKSTEKPILLNLADKLVEAQREVDELALQLALGKAEVKEKYEEVKKEFRYRVVNFKNALLNRQSNEVYKDLIARLNQLEERLKTGKLESREKFVEERKFILKTLRTIEVEIKNRLPDSEDVKLLKQEIEVFKLKLEILHLKFLLKRFTIKEELKSDAAEVRRRVSNVIDKARKKILVRQRKLVDLNKDIKKKIFS